LVLDVRISRGEPAPILKPGKGVEALQSPGRVFSREQLLDGVWGHDVYIDERTVDVHVGRLRRAINLEGKPDPIRTVRGAGYAFDETFTQPTLTTVHTE
jgi:DNA-binding winged helix-turn-helix (wHTH) protein